MFPVAGITDRRSGRATDRLVLHGSSGMRAGDVRSSGVVAMRPMSRATLATLLGPSWLGVSQRPASGRGTAPVTPGRPASGKHGPFGTPLAATSGSDNNYVGDFYPGTTDTLNDSASSVRNAYSNNDVVWHVDDAYGGAALCIDSGKERGYLYGLNDAFSSHSIAVDGTC